MRVFIWSVLILIVAAVPVFAQSGPSRWGWGYGYSGFGGWSGATSAHLGGGGELLLVGGFGAGLDLGHFGSTRGDYDNSLTMVSGNLCYHLSGRKLSKKGIPFITGGISAAAGKNAAGNFGFGYQYWIRPRVGLRFEFREHVSSSDSPFGPYALHIGLAIR